MVKHLPTHTLPMLVCMILLADPQMVSASDTIYVANGNSNVVGTYDAITGSVINGSLANSGMNSPTALALDGTGRLYVGNFANFIGVYNAFTGAPINSNLIGSIPGTSNIAVDTSNHVFSSNTGKVTEYNATTGAVINTNFINGISPSGLTIDLAAGRFYVSNSSTTVGVYNPVSGTAINSTLITGLINPGSLALDGAGHIFVVNNGKIGVYDAGTGVAINTSLITGLSFPRGIAYDNGDLFVVQNGLGVVSEYNAANGNLIKANFISGLSSPTGIVIAVPEPGSLLFAALAVLAAMVIQLGVWLRRRRLLLRDNPEDFHEATGF